eukprot:scaffold28254_cov59-Phaeocystis_antarctica.AAC.2
MREPCAAWSPGVRCGLPQDGSTVLGEVAGAVDRDGTTRRSAVLDDRYTRPRPSARGPPGGRSRARWRRAAQAAWAVGRGAVAGRSTRPRPRRVPWRRRRTWAGTGS